MSPRVREVLWAYVGQNLYQRQEPPLLGAVYGESSQEVKLESATCLGKLFLQQAASGSLPANTWGADLHIGTSAKHCPKLKH